MPLQRQVMKFLIPLSSAALGRQDLVGRAAVPIYINPQTFKINEKKIINSTLTKGGYSIQYWGEELAAISASGSTGSGGIEAINILRMIYRNEIHVFNELLRQRAENSQEDFINAFGTVGELRRGAAFGESIKTVLDDLTQGGATGIVDGLKSNLEEIGEAAYEITALNPISVELLPTMGAFASSIILYFQGEKFQGYFTSFDYDESADSPGIFTYNFSFTVVKRSGIRRNFMPWHRNPYDATGAPTSASTPKEGAREDELSFQTAEMLRPNNYQLNPRDIDLNNQQTSVTSSFKSDQAGQSESNNVGINRRNATKGS